MCKRSSPCEQSRGDKQQGILSQVMPEGHNYGLISNSETGFLPTRHHPSVPAVCGMAGTENIPLLLAQWTHHAASHRKPALDARQSFPYRS